MLFFLPKTMTWLSWNSLVLQHDRSLNVYFWMARIQQTQTSTANAQLCAVSVIVTHYYHRWSPPSSVSSFCHLSSNYFIRCLVLIHFFQWHRILLTAGLITSKTGFCELSFQEPFFGPLVNFYGHLWQIWERRLILVTLAKSLTKCQLLITFTFSRA